MQSGTLNVKIFRIFPGVVLAADTPSTGGGRINDAVVFVGSQSSHLGLWISDVPSCLLKRKMRTKKRKKKKKKSGNAMPW